MTLDEAFLMFRLYESLIDEGRGWRNPDPNKGSRIVDPRDIDIIHQAIRIAFDHDAVTRHEVWERIGMDPDEHAADCGCWAAKLLQKKDADD